MKVRKFCLCGAKLERNVSDEEEARALVSIFRLEHSGAGHGPTDERGYRIGVSKLIAIKNARSKFLKDAGPIIAAITRAENNGRRTHEWENKFGIEFCLVCLVVRSDTAVDCKGAALVLWRDAVPSLVRKESGDKESFNG